MNVRPESFRLFSRAAMTLLLSVLTTMTAWADTETVSYIDADGNAQTVTATVLTGNEEPSQWGTIDLAAGWYVVKGNISYTTPISFVSYPFGTIHIILADGAQMSVEYNGNAAILLGNDDFPLAIYGQSAGTGRLSVTSDRNAIAASGGITINGGIVSATSTGGGFSAIYTDNGAITINGGQVTATPGDNAMGISTEGTITLGLRSVSDFITANGYNGTVNIKDGQALKDPSGNIYYGTLTDAQKSAIANVTLQPATQAEFIAAALPQTAADTYTISDATGWNVFCDLLADNTKGYFSGKTVLLDADITVTRMAGGDNHDFTGTFDGGGHTLTFSHTATDNYCAPFRHVQGATAETPAVISNLNVVSTVTANDYRHMAGLIALQSGYVSVTDCNVEAHISNTKGTVNTSDLYPAALVSQSNNTGVLTVSGCTTTGQIATDGKYAAGLIGIVQNTATIENCRASVTIQSTTSGDGTHGGLVASQSSGTTITITGCVFDGSLLGSATSKCGGFIGYRNGTATIYNSLFAPAEVTVQKANSATFARNDVDTHNCYYTYYLCDGEHYVPYYATDGITRRNGHATRTVAAGADVTIEAVALTGTATQYTVSGITAYSGGGLQRGQTLYYGSGDQLSLTLSNSATGAPLGYQYGYTASAGTLSGSTLTMPDQDVTISVNTDHLASTGQPVAVAYVDADGTLHDGDDAAQAVALDGSETSLGTYGKEKWYFVGTDICHTGEITCRGDVHIILCDGKTMTVDGNGSNALWSPFGNFYFYGQNGQTGTLNATGCIDAADNNAGTLTINGGIINATGDYGISAYGLIINRGTVNATATNGTGIWSGGNITLGWSKPTDRISITASSYYGTVAVAEGKALTDGNGHFYSGTLSTDDITALNGKTLRPAASATYLDANGSTATADAILLDGSDTSLPAGYYLATGTLNYTHGITLTGNVTLILADNCQMNVGTSSARIESSGIISTNGETLTVTSQSLGNDMGALDIYNTGGHNIAICASAITINGGSVTADTDGKGSTAFYTNGTDITINGGTVSANTTGSGASALAAYRNFIYNGGNVTATATSGNAISAYDNYTFSWRNAADRITIGATGLYVTDGTTATFTKAMTDGTTAYSTTLTGDELNALKDKTLQPCAVATFAPEGYATYYHGMFDVTLPEGVKARIVTARVDDEGTLTYQTIADGDTDAKVVPAGTAVMLQTAKSTQSQQKTLLFGIHGNNSPAAPAANFLHGSDTEGLTTGDGKHYKLSYNTQGNDIGWYWGAADGAAFQSGAHKAWLVLPDGANARFFTLPDYDDATSLREKGIVKSEKFTTAQWYTLDGRKLSDKPTKAGLYINNGHKVVIK